MYRAVLYAGKDGKGGKGEIPFGGEVRSVGECWENLPLRSLHCLCIDELRARTYVASHQASNADFVPSSLPDLTRPCHVGKSHLWVRRL